MRLSDMCPACGGELDPGWRFCIHCGISTSVERESDSLTQSGPEVSPRNPFHRLRVRSFLVWVAAGIPVLAGMFVVANLFFSSSDAGIDPFIDALILNTWFYGLMAAWVLGRASGSGVDFRLLVGGVPSGFRWGPVVGMVGLLMLFTVCTSWLFLYFISTYLPHALDTFTSEAIFTTGERSRYAGLYNAQAFIVTVAVAPVVEELFFRGVLFTRWSLKWGPTAGVIASSILFGILHVGFFGAFAFGAAMCLLYIKTNTLLVPIAAHILNNFVASVFSAIAVGVESGGGSTGFQASEAGLMVAIAGTAATLTLLLWYLIRNWPRGGETAPYILHGAAE